MKSDGYFLQAEILKRENGLPNNYQNEKQFLKELKRRDEEDLEKLYPARKAGSKDLLLPGLKNTRRGLT